MTAYRAMKKANAFLGGRDDPYVSFNFRVEIDGIEVFGFREVNPISNETEVVEYQEGGLNDYVHKLVGPTKHSSITLKYGVTLDTSMYDWRRLVIDGNIDEAKRDGTIMFVENGVIYKKWLLYNAWPSKWEGPNFNSMEDAIAISSLELTVEKVEESDELISFSLSNALNLK